MANIKIQNIPFNETHELFVVMLYEIMLILNRSENCMDFFYERCFKTIPVYMQAMIIFYIYEIEAQYA
jgi:hypothetical protein